MPGTLSAPHPIPLCPFCSCYIPVELSLLPNLPGTPLSSFQLGPGFHTAVSAVWSAGYNEVSYSHVPSRGFPRKDLNAATPQWQQAQLRCMCWYLNFILHKRNHSSHPGNSAGKVQDKPGLSWEQRSYVVSTCVLNVLCFAPRLNFTNDWLKFFDIKSTCHMCVWQSTPSCAGLEIRYCV
jgi:hypothetical protein